MADLNTNQRKALEALLAAGTVKEAAELCGVTARTLFRYLADDDFSAELHGRQDAILAGYVAKLSTLTGESVARLERSLELLDAQLGQEDARIAQSAADRLGRLVLGLLEQRRKQAELEDLAERVAALEARG